MGTGRGRMAVALLGLVLLAGCGRADTGGHAPLTWPPGLVVASYKVAGGLVPSSWRLFDEPGVVVYSDGRAVTGASRTLTLSPTEVSDLVRGLRGELAGFGPVATPATDIQVVDAPSTTFAVRTDGGDLRSVSAYALGVQSGYDRRLVAAKHRMDALDQRIRREGTPYTSDRIRLVAEVRPDGGTARAWPDGVALPPPSSDGSGVRVGDLTGAAAAAVVAALGEVAPGGMWPLLRTGDGTVYAVNWRYLLPDE